MSVVNQKKSDPPSNKFLISEIRRKDTSPSSTRHRRDRRTIPSSPHRCLFHPAVELHTAVVRSTCPAAAEAHSTSLAVAADHHSSRPVVVGHSSPAAHLVEGSSPGQVRANRSRRCCEVVGTVRVRRSRVLENRMCCLRAGRFVRYMDLRRSGLGEVVGGMEGVCCCPVLKVVS